MAYGPSYGRQGGSLGLPIGTCGPASASSCTNDGSNVQFYKNTGSVGAPNFAAWNGTAPAYTGVNVVAATVSLAGVTAAQFDATAQTAFKEVIATYLSICGTQPALHNAPAVM